MKIYKKLIFSYFPGCINGSDEKMAGVMSRKNRRATHNDIVNCAAHAHEDRKMLLYYQISYWTNNSSHFS